MALLPFVFVFTTSDLTFTSAFLLLRASSRHAWTEAADTSDQKIYLHAGLGSQIQSFDYLFVDQRVHLAENGSRPAIFGVVHFTLDHFQDKLVKRLRRRLNLFQFRKNRNTGQPVKQLRAVGGNFRIPF